MEKDATDSYSCKQDKYAPFSFFTSSSVLFFTSSSVLFYSQTAFFSAPVSLYPIIKPSKISFFFIKSSSLSTSCVDLSNKLDKNSKLNSNKWKHYIDNNLYLYCRSKEYKVDKYSKKQSIWAYLAIVTEYHELP